MELERIIFGRKVGGICCRNGKEMERKFLKNQVEENFDGMEWKWRGIETEKV